MVLLPRAYMTKYINILQKIDTEELSKLKDIIVDSQEIIILGNGGSNAIASHISQDYTKVLGKKSFSFSDASRLTCYINDYGMENAYEKFLQHFASSLSTVILISSSGESVNILNAAKFCYVQGIRFIILTGFKIDNKLRQLYGDIAQLDFWVNSNDYGLVECTHEAILHSVTFPAKKVGFVAGCFDVIHPGYIELFNFAKEHCDFLIVGLHEDATYRPNKLKPVLSVKDRFDMLNSLKQIDQVIPYKTEEDLLRILTTTKIDVRFLGTDYINDEQRITGSSLNIPIVYHDRSSGWSTTKFKNLIKDSL